MNKKAKWGFLHFLLFTVFIIMAYIAYLTFFQDSELNEFRSSIGENEVLLTNLYQDYQEDILKREIITQYSLDLTDKQFLENNAVKESCKGAWKFNSDCDPDFESYYAELLKNTLNNYNIKFNDIKIKNNQVIINFGNLEYGNNTRIINVTYKNEAVITKKTLDFEQLNSIKEQLRSCILQNKLDSCFADKKENKNIITFNLNKIKRTIFINSEVETLYFNFKIDKDNTGLNPSF
mgnify:CR=1 FL=1